MQLLKSALAIIDKDGGDALTVRALVRESGISNGSVYHHLGSLDRLRSAAADEATRMWSTDFLTALQRGGYSAAAAADRAWSRAHPGLAQLVDDEGRRGRLGPAARQFGFELRAWLDAQQLAIGAPGYLVAATAMGPLFELRRLEHATGQRPSDADLESLGAAVTAALAGLSRVTQPQLPGDRPTSHEDTGGSGLSQ